MSTPFWKRKPMYRETAGQPHVARINAPGSVASPARCTQLHDLPARPLAVTVCPSGMQRDGH